MSDLEGFLADLGASFRSRSPPVVDHYGRPARTHQAVRNGVGVLRHDLDVIEVTGEDRIDYVDNVITNHLPRTVDRGCYACLLDGSGRVRADLYVLTVPDRLLLFLPPGLGGPVIDDWEVFIEDVAFADLSAEMAAFEIQGPASTEKLASVLTGASPPADRLAVERGSIAEAGVTLFHGDDLCGEEGYTVICSREDAVTVLDSLLNRGLNAVPMGRATWETLTLEAGTPLFETEIRDRLPNVLGLRRAIDFEKGCFLGQEVVARLENRGSLPQRLTGVELPAPVDEGTALRGEDGTVGEVTRSVESPTLDRPIGLALVDFELPTDAELALADVDGTARQRALPFHEGSARSARVPEYPSHGE